MRQTFTEAYIECALWASSDENETPLDELDAELSKEAREQMESDCTDFQQANRALLDEAIDVHHVTEAQLGHDFWLTRNHHGAGFWDRGLGELGDYLTDAAQTYGSQYLYLGDDGLIYAQG